LANKRAPRLLVGPVRDELFITAVERGGGQVVDQNDGAGQDGIDGIILFRFQADELAAVLEAHPGVQWVQLPMAGVERVVDSGFLADPRWSSVTWTCAKGSFARPVAEHALVLALAGLRHLPERARATTWGRRAGTTLYGADVTILGGGGIATELLALLAPFEVNTTVVRKNLLPLEGATRTIPSNKLHSALPGALVVFLALALSSETIGILGEPELSLMGRETWLVNVARGRHVRTDDLVNALEAGRIGGAALDVTHPEPLPDGHPLWSMPNCLITPHTADTEEMTRALLAERVEENVRRLVAGLPFIGVVDPVVGY
jgi:phosphoglycerate dehydrogenase-like enzyme